MSELTRAIDNAIDICTQMGGDLEQEIEETPGRNTAANRLRLKRLVEVEKLLEKAMKLAP